MKRFVVITVIVASLVAAAGCELQMTTPDGYVRLQNPAWVYGRKFVSAHGVYVAVRNPLPAEGGSLDFWATAVRNELIRSKGYTLAKTAEITNADGTAGRCMDFTANIEGRRLGYAVALWVDGDKVIVAEAGGPKQEFDADRGAINAALGSVTLR